MKATFAQGQALVKEQRWAEAAALFRQVLAAHPGHFEALHMLGVVALNAKQFAEALAWINKSLEVNPASAVAYSNRGNAFKSLMQAQAAIDSYDKAIALKPDYAEAYYNRAATQKDLQQFDAALESYDRAIALKPAFAEAYYNRGNLLRDTRQPEAAIASYEKAMAAKPGYTVPNLNLGLCNLQLGNFEGAWEKYEWRRNENAFRHFTQPRWMGTEPLVGKTILLHCEQGLGDTIQFVRYAKLVRDLGARVLLDVQAPLMDLMAGLEGVAQLVAKGSALPPFDCHCPLLSLPLAFKTRLGSIPSAAGYLAPLPDKVAQWQARLGPKTRPRVGLVWSGSAGHKNDQNRSFPLAELMKHMPEGIQYISLQKEVRDTDQTTLMQHPAIVHLGEEIKDFTDTAAVCALVDVVLSADTSVVHLAGAMGRPVWVLLPFNPDWRWLLDRSGSPWYDSATLYRQTSMGDWNTVFEKAGADLERFVS